MEQIIKEALVDSLKMVPWLFVIYFLTELMEYKYGGKVREKIVKAKSYGPLIGALFGIIPQCGFSVIGAALYSQRVISTGTLVAIFLSTSDEALPIIISQPEHLSYLFPVITCKVAIAIIAGYIVDLVFNRSCHSCESRNPVEKNARDPRLRGDDNQENKHLNADHLGCCHHHLETCKKSDIIFHPIKHTLLVFLYVFIVTAVFGILMDRFGAGSVDVFSLKGSLIQPFIIAAIGLIPNCAASVVITQSLLSGVLSFGSAMAGLLTAGGLGIIVLVKENKNILDTARVIATLYFIGALTGLLLQVIWNP